MSELLAKDTGVALRENFARNQNVLKNSIAYINKIYPETSLIGGDNEGNLLLVPDNSPIPPEYVLSLLTRYSLDPKNENLNSSVKLLEDKGYLKRINQENTKKFNSIANFIKAEFAGYYYLNPSDSIDARSAEVDKISAEYMKQIKQLEVDIKTLRSINQ